MRTVFFGSPNFTLPIVKKLKENFDVVKTIQTPQRWNNETIGQLKSLNPDFFVVASFGQILPGKVIKIPRLAAINIHPSLLPKYRGASPIQSAILSGDKKTGVTFIKMDEKVDHGPILDQFEDSISETDTFESLAIRLFDKSADVLVHVIKDYEKIKSVPQDDSKANYTNRLTKDDGYIDMSQEPLKIENLKLKIRAYYPWPGVWTKYKLADKELIIKFLPDKFIQAEGKKPMSYKDFINGYPNGKVFLQKLSLI